MPPAHLPPHEAARLAALESLNVLDTPATEVFDSFVRVARNLFETPIAAVSLVARDRQWFKAIHGLPVSETPRDLSFCAHAILHPAPAMVVPDATRDPRFADNALVTGDPGIRFYAGAPIRDQDGYALGALCVIDRTPRDASAQQVAGLCDLATGVAAALRLHGTLRRLEDAARTDPLTGLGNRREFDAALPAMTGRGATLFLLDIDGFKGINDAFGHPGGDLALRAVADRLRNTGRAADRAFRLGGDEFALLTDGPAIPRAEAAIAARIHAALADTFAINGQPVTLRTSIGVASLPQQPGPRQPSSRQPGPQQPDAAADLLRRADVALHEAKRAGRGTTRQAPAHPLAHTGSHPAPTGIGRIGLADHLRAALLQPGREPFTLVFQPVVDLRSGRVASLEALVRWQHGPDRINVPPAEFVVLAERLGLVSHLDRWVLAQACRAAVAWPEPWAVSVNVSALSFGLIDVVGLVCQALDGSGLVPTRLIVEMTETALAEDANRARAAVAGLRALGVGVALDDFGGGHGSLTALRQFAFSNLKIDRSLVQGIADDPVQAHMVQLVAGLGQALGIDVVAEGVETDPQLSRIAALGVTRAQGFWLARPAPPNLLEAAVQAAEAAVHASTAALPRD